MTSLELLLKSIPECKACFLMTENQRINIDYLPIIPKPEAKVIFIGRDPSPRSVQAVGERGGLSVFINEMFELIDDAGVREGSVYITNLCKCHWRTSFTERSPIEGTKKRPKELDKNISEICMRKWLIQEIGIINPRLIIGFGDDLYQIIKYWIVRPRPVPKLFSATMDKSILDAEIYVAENGPMRLSIEDREYQFMIMRHPGSSSRLPPIITNKDRRREYYQKARDQSLRAIKEACI